MAQRLHARHSRAWAGLAFGLVGAAAFAAPLAGAPRPPALRHVLLISVDGLHAVDLRRFIDNHPDSAFAALAIHGTVYTQARSPAPADSFPGLLALVTGGTPAVTGVYYDVSFDRALSPPGPSGSGCTARGTVVSYDEGIDAPGGTGTSAIDPARLPRDPAKGCQPVWPHAYLRVNTVFEVAHDAGLATAWADKHPAYDIVNGPSGHGVDDLYTPEIGADYPGASAAAAGSLTGSVDRTAAYDQVKAGAVAHWIDGLHHDGLEPWRVPALFGLNLQAVNVGQKRGGYLDAKAQPSPLLASALAQTDALVGHLVQDLQQQGLMASTLIVLTAKHGNSPIDPHRLRHIDRGAVRDAITRAAGTPPLRLTTDGVALAWLQDPATAPQVGAALLKQRGALGISRVVWGVALGHALDDAPADSRRPDLVIEPRDGVIYSKPGDDKRAEHGGFGRDDRAVALLLSNPVWFPHPRQIAAPVTTTQVAPTLLVALGLPPQALRALAMRPVQALPGLPSLKR